MEKASADLLNRLRLCLLCCRLGVFIVFLYYKRVTRGFFVLLSLLAVGMPRVIEGYIRAITVEAHPTILYFTGFCLLAFAFTLYYLRDYDTLFSIPDRQNL